MINKSNIKQFKGRLVEITYKKDQYDTNKFCGLIEHHSGTMLIFRLKGEQNLVRILFKDIQTIKTAEKYKPEKLSYNYEPNKD